MVTLPLPAPDLPDLPDVNCPDVDTSGWLHPNAPTWLSDRVAFHTKAGGLFHLAVAAGETIRLDKLGVGRRVPTGVWPTTVVEVPDPEEYLDTEHVEVLAWIESLDDEQVEALVAYAEAEAGLLWQRIVNAMPGCDWHPEGLRSLLEARDRLESVWVTLENRSGEKQLGLSAWLDEFDHYVYNLRRNVRHSFQMLRSSAKHLYLDEGQRWAAISLSSGGSWWASLDEAPEDEAAEAEAPF